MKSYLNPLPKNSFQSVLGMAKKKEMKTVKLQINLTHYLHTLVLINLKILTILEIKHIKQLKEPN